MFSKLLDKILRNKRNLLLILVGFFLFLTFTDNVFAATEAATFQETKTKISQVVQFISTVIAVFLALITYLVTMFLSPEWINGSLFGLNSVFKSIWILVSNVVYVIFAFILIWIAFMNIIGKGGDKYQIKQALPKFIVGILIVPFSWFLVNFILSLSSVLTISALNLPFDVFKTYSTDMSAVQIPTSCTFNPDNLGKTTGSTDLNKILECKDENRKPLMDLINSNKSGDSIFGVIAVYTYGILSLENFDYLNASYIMEVKNMVQLVIKLVFDFLFIVIYSILMIALGLVLMTRGIYLWIYMMLSPVFGLMYFFDKTEGGSGFFEKFNLKQFISLAFVPVFAMLALSFGLLFMYVVGNGMSKGPSADAPPSNISIKENTFKINEIEFTLSGSISSEQNITDFFKAVGGKTADSALGVIGSLILKIFGIVVLWGAMMAALRTNEITKAVIEPLYQFGTKVGEIAKSAPQYAPIFGGQSMTSLSSAAGRVSGDISQIQQKKGNALAEKFLPKSELGKKYSDALTRTSHDADSAINNIRHLNTLGKSDDIAASPQAIEAYSKNLQKLNENNKFKDSELAKKLIEKLNKEGKSNPAIVREILSELDGLAVNGFSILGVDGRTATGQVDSELGGGRQQNPPAGGDSNQTINLNIAGVNPINFDGKTTKNGEKITGLSDTGATEIASSIGNVGSIKKSKFIDDLKAALILKYGTNNITEADASKMAKDIADALGDAKFQQ